MRLLILLWLNACCQQRCMVDVLSRAWLCNIRRASSCTLRGSAHHWICHCQRKPVLVELLCIFAVEVSDNFTEAITYLYLLPGICTGNTPLSKFGIQPCRPVNRKGQS